MMDLKQMLDEALARVDSMTAEDFESECINAGYVPVRKHTFNMSEKSFVMPAGPISYKDSGYISVYKKIDFTFESANDFTLKLAA